MAQFIADSTRDQMLERPLPHSADAERAILGAVVLDNALVNQAVELLRPEDFYIRAHQFVFRAMTALSERGSEINPILLGEELRREGALEQTGGIAFISELTYGLPHFTNVAAYAKVVKDHSLMRQLVKVANKITSEALEGEDEAAFILDHAEAMIFALADERTRQGFSHIKPVADQLLEKVQEMAGRSAMLTGLTTGFTELDTITSGLQPSDLVIVAARPSMGKTALCLTLAQNAAIQSGAVVGIFSLEMSKESLVMRMLCSEGRVDAHRFRSGYLSRDEWARLAGALGTLADAKIFIDDTPGISVLEMRAKARRLASEQKRLDLIVVDYLQLMSGSSRRAESRQQEVSQISRELKGLAKELNVPLVALSQLSRAPEARSDHRPQLSDLRESGCLAGDSLVTLADTGERVAIRELNGKSDFAVWALNEQTWETERAVVSRAFATGVKPVYRLVTKLGRTIRATANHKFRAFDAWKRLDELAVGERLALPRFVPSPLTQTMTNSELALLGHLIGDGCTLPRHVIQYTTRERDLAELVASLAVEVFGDEVRPRVNEERRWYQVYLTSTRHHTHNVRSAIAEWLDELGAWGLRSYEKFIPGKVFKQSREAIALFLRHLWATDGCIWADEKSGKHHPGIYYATSSKSLAHDVQSLLLRVRINARLRSVSQEGKGRDQYHVIVSGKSDIERFINSVGAVGLRKKEALTKVGGFISQTKANTNRDSIPHEVWEKFVVPSMVEHGITTRQMFTGINTAYCGTGIYKQNISRERASLIARAVRSDKLSRLAQSDVFW
ncbi:MAG TPA: replicative DNA helicase, partial [Pyrinomonadaceae bacterium]|nr:replicative DNA helicase [Pyrinomonadaceae bacterium]